MSKEILKVKIPQLIAVLELWVFKPLSIVKLVVEFPMLVCLKVVDSN